MSILFVDSNNFFNMLPHVVDLAAFPSTQSSQEKPRMGNFVWTRKAEPVWTILEEGVAVRSKKNGNDEVGRLGNGAKVPGNGALEKIHVRCFFAH